MHNPPTSVLTIGNFDGVHRGHQKLISTVVEKASALRLKSHLITFDPHPLQVLAPQKGIKTIFPLEDRLHTITALGIENISVLPFSRDLSEMGPGEFFNLFIANNTQELVVGHDFNFGKNRMGTLEILKELCAVKNITLHVEQPFKISSETVSSSKIRSFIATGQMEKANLFLGRDFYVTGMVEKGAGRGKQIGIPTANLFSRAELFPQKGVYVSHVNLKGKEYKSITNVGDNPTFDEGKAGNLKSGLKIETHILDFAEEIYGEKLRVSFLSFLREEKKFKSVEALVQQINSDILKARAYPWKNQ